MRNERSDAKLPTKSPVATGAFSLTYAPRARTPLLIQQAELDDLAPRAGANELHRALRDAGVPTEMIVFDGATHAGFSLRQRLGLLDQNLGWFAHWIWDEPLTGIP